jgi:NADH dehydrogenase (ubiquinone) Fe-S protein 3
MLTTNNLKLLCDIVPVYKLQIYNSKFITLLIKQSKVLTTLLFFKNHTNSQLKLLTCIVGVDYLHNRCRFQLIYEILSLRYNSRLRVKTFSSEINTIDSSKKIFSAAKWYESEIWDMFGVFFKNNPNIRRLLTDYGFKGYPLRKDFPLSGFIESKYNLEKRQVTVKELELSQEYRNFKISSPWEMLFLK